jgi:Fe-S oxidoreductase
MSMAYFVANESVELAMPFANPAWACTGCFGCRERCDHRNDVTGTLFEARSALMEAGQAPPSARRVRDGFAERAAVLEIEDARAVEAVDPNAHIAVLVGCEHARRRTDAGVDIVRAVARLSRSKVAVVRVCCGAPLLYAGDHSRFVDQGKRFVEAVQRHERLIVGDAGCASTLRVHLAHAGVEMPIPVEHLSELAAREVMRLAPLRGIFRGAVRWHDPCQLGRGLGIYDAPRHVLTRALGRAPDEFDRNRTTATCSGAGGLLPSTMPAVARTIASQRAQEHESAGGGTIVTSCASSLRSLSRAGAQVVDLATVIMRALDAAERE